MAEFIYKSTIYGHRTFTVADEGGIVVYKGRQLAACGGFLTPGTRKTALRADAKTLESAARRWWKHRTGYLNSLGRQANNVDP